MDLHPPNNIAKKPTQAELLAFHNELKRYEASLKRWDMQLQEREDALEMAEQALLDDGEGCDCGFEQMSEGCGCGWCGELRAGVAAGGPMAKSFAQFQAAKEPAPGREELAFLDRLYKLKDPRKA
jgi:hypothetical protein